MKMAVVTNKPTEFTLPLLKHFGMDRYFEHVVSGDTCTQKKPHPMPLLHACDLLGVRSQDALAIGDSVNDALAARAAKDRKSVVLGTRVSGRVDPGGRLICTKQTGQ